VRYEIDLRDVSLQVFAGLLARRSLTPGRRILLERLEARFQRMESAGVRNLGELKARLSAAQKLSAFSARCDIPEAYLVALKREVGSLVAKPVLLTGYPDISQEVVQKLEYMGIKSSKAFFELYHAMGGLEGVCVKTGISKEQGRELYGLCDLVRVNGLGPAAAKAFYEAGINSADGIARANAKDLLEAITKVNAEKGYYRAKLGEKDMQFAIDSAKLLLDLNGA
jgi:hypothetical protein